MFAGRVLILADRDLPGMAPVGRAVTALCRDADIRRVGTPDEVDRLTTEECWYPELAIVCQHWTREYTLADVNRLVELLPLVRIVCCYGAWCASDGRSGTPWPLSVRVPVDDIAARLRREFEVLCGRRAPLPLTASRDEIWLFDRDLTVGRAAQPIAQST